jgi:hypothetical protein
MKKLIFSAVAVLLYSFSYAQITNNSIKLGAKAGLNISNIIKNDGNNNFNTDYLAGFHAGLTVEIPLLERLAFTPEVLYATKGYKSNSIFGEFTQTTHFIDVPILASVKVADKFNVVLGPQVSFLLQTNNKFETGFGTAEQKIVEDDSDQFKKSLVGGVIGFSYDITDQVGINGRYALDFQKNNENGSSQTPEYKNQVFQIGLGIKF